MLTIWNYFTPSSIPKTLCGEHKQETSWTKKNQINVLDNISTNYPCSCRHHLEWMQRYPAARDTDVVRQLNEVFRFLQTIQSRHHTKPHLNFTGLHFSTVTSQLPSLWLIGTVRAEPGTVSAGPGFNPQTRQNKLFQDYWRACFEISFSDRQEGLTVSSIICDR